jgi:hypothetical protein
MILSIENLSWEIFEDTSKYCYRLLGVPGEEEQINVVLFVNES